MDKRLRSWIVDVLEQHRSLLAVAVRQRAKFEGWLKFELAVSAEKQGAESVEVETASDAGSRSDLSFLYGGQRYDVELKTCNTNWRMKGVFESDPPDYEEYPGRGYRRRQASEMPGPRHRRVLSLPCRVWRYPMDAVSESNRHRVGCWSVGERALQPGHDSACRRLSGGCRRGDVVVSKDVGLVVIPLEPLEEARPY